MKSSPGRNHMRVMVAVAVALVALFSAAIGATEPVADGSKAAPPPAYSAPADESPAEPAGDAPGAAAAPGVFCNKIKDRFHPTRVDTRVPMGDGVSLELCQTFVAAAREGVVCTRIRKEFFPRKIATLQPLGDGLTSDQCTQATSGARNGLVCTRIRKEFFPRVIETLVPLGDGSRDLATCLRQLGS